MRFLKFDLYEGGHVGVFNNLMSLELAVGLCVLSGRRLLLNEPPHAIFNSERSCRLLDLMDLCFPHQVGQFAQLRGELLPDLHSRQVGLDELWELHSAPVVATCNDRTLGYYSYTLPGDPRVVYACNQLIVVKERYRLAAAAIVNELRRRHGTFASIHVRRKDFLGDHERTGAVAVEEMLHNLSCHVSPDTFLVIHSDELEPEYFAPLLQVFEKHCLIDITLSREFCPNVLDSAELGLISALVASASDMFLGTMFSTFTGYIQRRRALSGKPGGFLYLYNQRPDCLAFRDGRILEQDATGPTWERIAMAEDLRSICFWWREWPESMGPGGGLN